MWLLTSNRSRPLRRAVLLLVALVLLAACGSDGDDDAAAAVDAADGTVTIDHALGSTSVDERPARIVTLGLQWTDAVLAMGQEPIGFAEDDLAGGDGRFPWHAERLGAAVALDVTDGVPVERVAALDPDLILVASHLLTDEAAYGRLSQIAPTIGGLDEGNQVDPWQDQVEVLGRVLGEPAQARSVIDEVEAQVAATAAELPGLAGKTFALANFVPGDSIYVVADPADGSSTFFQQLGMELPPDLLAAADGVSGRAQLSLEQAHLLGSDLLVLFTNGGEATDLVGYDRLPAVLDEAVAVLDYVAVVGLNTPTPLSIPYSLDVVRPALAAAAS